jgi:opacity protein-like surface antigen
MPEPLTSDSASAINGVPSEYEWLYEEGTIRPFGNSQKILQVEFYLRVGTSGLGTHKVEDSEVRMRIRRLSRIKMGSLILVFLLGVCMAHSPSQEIQAYLFGGWYKVFEYGEEEDYVMGENDFPVTPGHTSFNFGAAVGLFFTRHLGVELDARYAFSTKVILEDPSDLDTVEVDTAKHYALSLNVVYRLLGRRLSPYLLVGVGMDRLLAQEETYISEYGYEIEFLPPEKASNFVTNVGGGIELFLLSNLGARIDVRYSVIFDEPHNQNAFNITAGLLFGF